MDYKTSPSCEEVTEMYCKKMFVLKAFQTKEYNLVIPL